MSTSKQQTTNYLQIFIIILVITLGLSGRWAYLWASNMGVEKRIDSTQEKIQIKNAELESFGSNLGFDKLQHVKNLEESNQMMPRSDHVNAIMAIFDELLTVDQSDTSNISFSNFEISLESIRLDGHVSNLRLLYQGSRIQDKDKPGLIERFEELDFLDDISIKTYEKTSGDYGYDFTLTANVINNGK